MQTHTSGIFYCLRFSRAALGWRTCMALAMWCSRHVEEMQAVWERGTEQNSLFTQSSATWGGS